MKVQKREAFFYHKRLLSYDKKKSFSFLHLFIQQEGNLSFRTYISIWFHFEVDFFFLTNISF